VLPLKVPSLCSSLLTELYDPRAFVTHAALLRQTFVHCARFPTAASLRSLGRVSVPMWLIILSDQLPIFGLVGHYPANYLMGREPILKRPKALTSSSYEVVVLCGISAPFGTLFPTQGYVIHVLLTRAPLYSGRSLFSFDLHVLSTPPAFTLSQDQTLQFDSRTLLALCLIIKDSEAKDPTGF
jgi:hypothetical protein